MIIKNEGWGGRTVFLQRSLLKVFETKTINIQAQSFFPLSFVYLPVCKLGVNVGQNLGNNQDLSTFSLDNDRGNSNRQLLRALFPAGSPLKSNVWKEKKSQTHSDRRRLFKATIELDETRLSLFYFFKLNFLLKCAQTIRIKILNAHHSKRPPPKYRTWCDIIINYTHINAARPQKET